MVFDADYFRSEVAEFVGLMGSSSAWRGGQCAAGFRALSHIYFTLLPEGDAREVAHTYEAAAREYNMRAMYMDLKEGEG